MNPVEIEEQISQLAEQPFDAAEFPYAFLEAFGNKATTLKKLRSGASNKSDLGGVLQTSNIHIANFFAPFTHSFTHPSILEPIRCYCFQICPSARPVARV